MVGLLDRVVKTIEKYKLIELGDKVLVGVSGGSDSIFLLYSLHAISKSIPFELMVGHLNHSLRDCASAEASFVRSQCDRLGIPCIIDSIDVNSYCCSHNLSLEEGARKLRYEFLSRVATDFGLSKIALGHTSTDQLETFILRIARGSGGHGLLSIPPKRQERIGSSIEIIRPLIEIRREEIITFLDKEGIDYCVDETNYDCRNVRNFVRHHIVPKLEELAPDFSYKVNKLRDILEEDERVLDNLAKYRVKEIQEHESEEWMVLDLSGFLSTPLAIKRRILRNLPSSKFQVQIYPSYDEVENAIKYIENSRGGYEFDFCGIKIVKSCGKLMIANYKTTRLEEYESELSIPGEVEVGKKLKVKSEKLKVENGKLNLIYDDSRVVYFDLDMLKFPLIIRNRRIGDRIKLKFGEKKLKEIFIDDKIPLWDRRYIPLLVDKEGILWIIGKRRSYRALVGENTKEVVKVWVEG